MPHILHDKIKDKFFTLEKFNMVVAAYEAKFDALCRFSTQLPDIENDWIHHFVKDLNTNFHVSTL